MASLKRHVVIHQNMPFQRLQLLGLTRGQEQGIEQQQGQDSGRCSQSRRRSPWNDITAFGPEQKFKEKFSEQNFRTLHSKKNFISNSLTTFKSIWIGQLLETPCPFSIHFYIGHFFLQIKWQFRSGWSQVDGRMMMMICLRWSSTPCARWIRTPE